MELKVSATNVKKNSESFGYSAHLNKRLQTTLSQQAPSDYVKSLGQLNNFCNTLEKTISQKFFKASVSETDPLIDMFIGLKTTLVDMIEEYFPHLDYLSREVMHYEKESLSPKSQWKAEISNALMGKIPRFFAISGEEGEDALSSSVGAKASGGAKNIINEFLPNTESPKGFSSLGGMKALQNDLRDKIISPITDPETAALDLLEYGKKLPRATLFFGPPGNGKTFLAEATAREAGVPFFKLKISEAGSKYINETSENYEAAFATVEAKSKEINKPCILFIDEIDGLGRNRDGQSNEEDLKQIGTLLDLINEARNRGVIVIGATNKHDMIDSAIKSRFDNQVFIGMPDKDTRKEVLKKSLEGKIKAENLLNSELDLDSIAEAFEGFSNRAITDLASQVAMIARNDGRRNISKDDYLTVIKKSQALKIMNGNKDYLPQNGTRTMGFERTI